MELYTLRETVLFEHLSTDEKIKYFVELAQKSFQFWNIPVNSQLNLLNYTENATFKVIINSGRQIIMRVHRLWYTNEATILSEIMWLDELKKKGIHVPQFLINNDGAYLVAIETQYGLRYIDCMAFESGVPARFSESFDFEYLGELIGKIHYCSKHFDKPSFYQRISWDFEGTFSTRNNFHNELYSENLFLSKYQISVIDNAVSIIKKKLEQYGKTENNYGLIHSDCRFANILQNGKELVILDFDDCGDGWYMYDLASVFGFNENHLYFQQAQKRLITGYMKVAKLSEKDIEMFDTFLLMRQIGLIGTGMFFEKYAVLGEGESNRVNDQWHSFYLNTFNNSQKYINKNH